MDNAFWRTIYAIRRKIYLIIGRGKLERVNKSDGKTYRLQITGLNGETITDVEFPQNYGFVCNPVPGQVDITFVAVDGNRDMAIALVANDRDNIPKDLASGDVRVYHKDGYQVKLGSLGIILKTGDASGWQPNTLTVDPMTGIPHGGVGAGIIKLKGE